MTRGNSNTSEAEGSRARSALLAAGGRLRAGFGGRRGTARLGVLVAAVAVAGGLAIGHGVAAQATKSGYDLAWLADGKRGQVVQVDPVLGRTNLRLQVADPGADIDVEQGNGQLIVIDHKTGKVTSIDLGTLLTGGSRATAAGADVKVLLAGERMYLADLDHGVIQAVDPRTEANIGTAWTAGGRLLDVGIDGKHKVWVLDAAEKLTSLEWKASALTLTPTSTRVLTNTGTGSVIIGHEQGVTVVGAGGTIARVGTGNDSTVHTTQIDGPLTGPGSSPQDIVPVSDKTNSSVVIIGSSGAVVDPVGDRGCTNPGGPLVFDGKVYVPCLGAGMVLVLDQNGNSAGSVIRTPGGGDPELRVSGGHLIVSAPGSTVATVIDTVGDSRTFPTVDPKTPVQDPKTPPPNPPDPPKPTDGDHGNDHSGDNGNGGGHSGGGSSPANPADPTDPGQSSASATALARQDGTVLVSWTGPDAPGGYTITSGSSSTTVARASTGASSATVTSLDPGAATTLTVHARNGSGKEIWKATTASVRVGGQDVSVGNLAYTATAGTNSVRLTATWTAATGSGVTYQLTSTGTSTMVPTTTTSTSIDVPCSSSCSGTLTVTPMTPDGAGSPSTLSWTGSATPDVPPPSDPTPPPADPTPPPADPTPPPADPTPTPIAMPAAGQSMVTAVQTMTGSTTTGDPSEVTVTVTSPADWQAWTDGKCTLIDTDIDTGISVPCNASGWTGAVDYFAIGTHTYQVRATATDGRISDSAGSDPITVRYVRGTRCIDPLVSLPSVAGVHALPPCNIDCPGQTVCQQPLSGQDAAHADAVTFAPESKQTIRFASASRPQSQGPESLIGWTALGVLLLGGLAGGETLRRRARGRATSS